MPVGGEAVSRETMVERVARAIRYSADGEHSLFCHDGFPCQRTVKCACAEQLARAAIEAMREPTSEMTAAADFTPQMRKINAALSLHQVRTKSSLGLGETPETSALAEAYRAMIDACLAEGAQSIDAALSEKP